MVFATTSCLVVRGTVYRFKVELGAFSIVIYVQSWGEAMMFLVLRLEGILAMPNIKLAPAWHHRADRGLPDAGPQASPVHPRPSGQRECLLVHIMSTPLGQSASMQTYTSLALPACQILMLLI
jgi:hypothetical protein